MSNFARACVRTLVLGFLAPVALMAQDAADTIYVNGNVYTVDPVFSTASAFAIKDGSFIYVGDEAGAREHVGAQTFVVDLDGKTVIPGLHDAHIHIRFGERIRHFREKADRLEIGIDTELEPDPAIVLRCRRFG